MRLARCRTARVPPCRPVRWACLLVGVWLVAATPAMARDRSAPAILQYFESTYGTIETRAPDLFLAGYGAVYTPPPGRAEQGSLSVGYDAYDRFDLGAPGNPTLYGTETGLRQTVAEVHKLGGNYYIDYVINHNGFADAGTPGFLDAGGYPGMVLQWPGTSDGDFNSAFDWGTVRGRLAGLVDIDHATNIPLVRNPVPGYADNIPAGMTPAYGRLANVPDETNRRFYPDHGLTPIMVYDPATGEGDIPIYPFNTADPMAGDPTAENVTGYLMRNAQWMVQAIGVDGFRIDAAKHIEGFALDYFDRAVYRASQRDLLDGSQRHVFSFCEVYDGNKDYLQTFVKKTIDPNQIGVIGGNRDALDFPLYFALKGNLEHTGTPNAWQNIRNASLDFHDDGLNNGSQGVMFVQSHDDPAPWQLANVAYAYVLMHPGNAVVYFNAQEFGTGRDFPKDGRADALGGAYGDTITRLVDLRSRYGEGDYRQRWIDDQGILVYERSGSCMVGLSNRGDDGFDERKVRVDLPWGTHLVELTGNAADPSIDPYNDIPEVVTVYDDFYEGPTYIDVRVPRNCNADGDWHGNGYVIYGLASPEGALTLDGVAATLPGSVPVLDGSADENAYANATTRLADIRVVTGGALQVRLATQAVRLLGLQSLRDRDADGDNALVRIDEGLDLNGNGSVDHVTPNSPAYGFEEFVTANSPGYFTGDGNGSYLQTVDTSTLAEGMHYLTVRAFRHRTDGGPAIWTDWKEVLYVDRLPPESAIASFEPTVAGVNENRDLLVRSLDRTADNVHVLMDLGAALSEGEILAMIGNPTQTETMDRDLFRKYVAGLTHGNHAAAVVTYEMTGTFNVQRFAGLFADTIFGRGLGDLDFDGVFSPADIDVLGNVYWSLNRDFNPAGDANGDGLIDDADVLAMGGILSAGGADPATMLAYDALVATVPEPATLALLLAGTLLAARRRR